MLKYRLSILLSILFVLFINHSTLVESQASSFYIKLLNQDNYKETINDAKTNNQAVLLELYWNYDTFEFYHYLQQKIKPFPNIIIRGIDCNENEALCKQILQSAADQQQQQQQQQQLTDILDNISKSNNKHMEQVLIHNNNNNKNIDEYIIVTSKDIREICKIVGTPITIVELSGDNVLDILYNKENKSVLVQYYYGFSGHDKALYVPRFEALSSIFANEANFMIARVQCYENTVNCMDHGGMESRSMAILFSGKRQQAIIYQGDLDVKELSEFIQDEINGNEFKPNYSKKRSS
ncbi:hypothetical protein PPL_02628 [Heterostelium album PN500]|uniref:Thioredoxin domain-containing protein n=1 Tax=Heterostelium pallidum (strain ATCC 26659 / Pp 5 / PN500) TaxID=670386 RepID=D3B2L4_HETP5|nr:hypothetical protein PPL_02628 [Heterostelium album PN500]EFA83562.1 hypothetical protein PPL_02628 [Heterostelium album PN500]|eukprot:XP_020435679.1 hypothetical protein PPL_02628 [Heterostelium album PN500]